MQRACVPAVVVVEVAWTKIIRTTGCSNQKRQVGTHTAKSNYDDRLYSGHTACEHAHHFHQHRQTATEFTKWTKDPACDYPIIVSGRANPAPAAILLARPRTMLQHRVYANAALTQLLLDQ